MHVHSLTRVGATVSLVIVVLTVTALPAASESSAPVGASAESIEAGNAAGDSAVARDVSFPQCSGSLPLQASADSGVLGTNDGISFTRNPCLVRQLAWAKSLRLPPAFYANTGNPGPQRARHWPIGQSSPRVCAASDPNSIGCSYDYGWNAAWHSYTVATDAAQQLHHVDRVNARHRAANVEWWLDVETMNSWQALDDQPSIAAQRLDVATIEGEVDALRAAQRRVGGYLLDRVPVEADHRRTTRDAGLVRRIAAVAGRLRVSGGCRARLRSGWLHRRAGAHDPVSRSGWLRLRCALRAIRRLSRARDVSAGAWIAGRRSRPRAARQHVVPAHAVRLLSHLVSTVTGTARQPAAMADLREERTQVGG